MPERPRVVIAGGGVAALEALLALRHLVGEQVSVVLLAPERSFVHRPSSVASPFGLGGPAPLDIQAIAEQQGARLRRAGVRAIDPARRFVTLSTNEALSYDALLIAVGAVPRPAVEGAIAFAGPAEAAKVTDVLASAERGEARRVAFAVPAGGARALPVYGPPVMGGGGPGGPGAP